MSVYADMDEAALIAEITVLRDRIRDAATSSAAGVRSVAGEGRRTEWFAGGASGSSASSLRRLLREATDALAALQGNAGGSAIGVRY